MFWSVFAADALWSACTITAGVAFTLAFKAWSRRRRAKAATAPPTPPGHCPLCGREWPLPGPLPQRGGSP